jgi:TolB protein
VPGFVGVPAWSPDGTRIAFAVTSFDEPHPEGGNVDVYVANADGSDPIRLTSEQVNHSPAWSPDGNRIAYVRGYNADGQIWVMDADGTRRQQLTMGTGPNAAPTWSPDGTQIAFVSYGPTGSDIYVMDADGSNVRQLTEGSAHDSDPAWSPDGTSIAFIRDGAEDFGIVAMSPDGTDVTPLLEDSDPANLGFAWSPDGTKIAAVGLPDRGSMRTLRVLDVATGEVTAMGTLGAYFGPSWQPLPTTATASPEPPS